MLKISAVVLTKNDESVIKRCLESLSWCDELIVIDDGSIDKTIVIAKKFGAKVYARTLQNDFAKQRNFGLSKATHEWVLFIDSDEVLTTKLITNIQKALSYPKYMLYSVSRKNVFIGTKLKFHEAGDKNLVRLVKKGSGVWKRSVHEYWKSQHPAGHIAGDLLHYSVISVKSLISKIGIYSAMHSNEITKEKKSVHLYKALLYPVAKFVKNFFIQKGYKDGVRGFILSVAMSFHSFLSWSQLCLKKR